MHTFSLQTRLYSGPGSLAALQRFSHQHIWIVCDGFLARSPLLDRLRAALPASNRVSVFSDITPDPTIHTVASGLLYRKAAEGNRSRYTRRCCRADAYAQYVPPRNKKGS